MNVNLRDFFGGATFETFGFFTDFERTSDLRLFPLVGWKSMSDSDPDVSLQSIPRIKFENVIFIQFLSLPFSSPLDAFQGGFKKLSSDEGMSLTSSILAKAGRFGE